MIQKSNYVPNTLRRNRGEAFELDLEKVYVKYQEATKIIEIEQMTMSIFGEIWSNNKMEYIFQCLSEEESEDEFAQLMYEIVLKKYFVYRQKCDKVFALFALYFLYFACENRKRISFCANYVNQLKVFVLENRNDKNSHYMKIAYQLHQKCISLCTKIGLRNPILKANGQTPRRPLIVGTNPLQLIGQVENEIREWNNPDRSSLRENLTTYDRLKKQLLKDYVCHREKFPLDTYFCNRVDRLAKNFKEYVQNIETLKKKQQQFQ